MRTRYYPDEHSVKKAMAADDPLLVCVREDGSAVLLSNIDDALEHHILLRKLGYADTDIDTYYRLILTRDGADWTFVCPSSYKGIAD